MNRCWGTVHLARSSLGTLRCSGWPRLAAWHCVAAALLALPALSATAQRLPRCGTPGWVINSYTDPAAGNLVPALDGHAVGHFGNAYSLTTARLVGSPGSDDHDMFAVGRYFLCNDAESFVDGSSATVTAWRLIGSSFRLDSSADNRWGIESADVVDGYYYTVQTRDWLSREFGLDSFSGQGHAFMMHVNMDGSGSAASYRPRAILINGLTFVGEVSFDALAPACPTCSPPTSALTYASVPGVVAHEWAHGVAEEHARLEHSREPGALSEAFSDWMGAAFSADQGMVTWEIGAPIKTVRDLRNPGRFAHPDTYRGAYWRPADAASCPVLDDTDGCWIHSNSTVGGKMFQLLADGGAHNGVRLAGVGLSTATRIAMDAQRFQWSRNSDYADARAGMRAAAPAYGSHAASQVELAWRAVCVDTPRPPPPACPVPNALRGHRIRVSSSELTGPDKKIVLQFVIGAPATGTGSFVGAYPLLAFDDSMSESNVIAATDPLPARPLPTSWGVHFSLSDDAELGDVFTLYLLLQDRTTGLSKLHKGTVRVSLRPTLDAERVAPGRSSVTMTLVSAMEGTALHLVLPKTAAAPSTAALAAHPDARVQAVEFGEPGAELSWAGLVGATDYVWYAVVHQPLRLGDPAGMAVYISDRLAVPFRTVGATPPAFTLTLSSVSRDSAVLALEASAAGTAYYLLVPDPMAGPIDATALAANSAVRSVPLAADTGVSVTWTGLAPGTAYTAYAAVRSAAGDYSALATAAVTTLPPLPTLTLALTAGRDSVDLALEASADGTAYYLLALSAAAAPASAAALMADSAVRSATLTAGSAVSVTWTGLAPATAYTAYAAVRSAAGDSALATVAVTTLPPLPTLTLALTSVDRDSAVLALEASAAGTAYYLLALSTAAAPASAAALMADSAVRSATLTAGSAVSVTWTGLAPATAYTAYAAVRSAAGDSALATAAVTTLPPLPTLTLALTAGRDSVDLALEASAAGTAYYLLVPDPMAGPIDATALAANSAVRSVSLAADTGVSVTWTGLAPATAYTAYAVVRSAAGDSALATAAVTTLPPLPTLTLALTSVDRDSAVLALEASAAGTAYYLLVPDSMAGPIDAAALAANPAARSATLAADTGVSVTWTGLAPGTAYTAYAVVRSAAGDSALETVAVTTLPPLPTLTLALASVGRDSVDLALEASAAGTAYYLLVPDTTAALAGAAELMADSAVRSATLTAGSAVSVTWTGLAPGAAYTAYAAVRSAAGDSALATVAVVTLPPLPTLTLALASVGRDSVDLALEASAAGTAYYLLVPDSMAGPIDATALAANPAARSVPLTAGSAVSVTWTGLLPGTAYTAYAAVRSAAGDSALETTAVTTLPSSAGPVDSSPTSLPTLTLALASVGRDSVDLALEASAAGTAYYLLVPDTTAALAGAAELMADSAVRSATLTAGSAVSVTWTGLAPGAAYTAYAAVRSAAGDSALATVAVTTLPPLPTLTLALTAGRDSAVLALEASAAGIAYYLLVPDPMAGPIDAAALAANSAVRSVSLAADTGVSVTWTGLAPGTAYTAYAVVRSAAGDSALETMAVTTLPSSAGPVDSSPTSLPTLTLALASVGRDSVDLALEASAAGTAYYLLVPDTTAALAAAAELMADSAVRSATLTAGRGVPVTWTGLAPGTAYTAYAAVRSAAGDSALATVAVTTLTSSSAPASSGGGCVAVAGRSGPGGGLGLWALLLLAPLRAAHRRARRAP